MHARDPIPALKEQVAAELVRQMHGSAPSEIYFWIGIDQPRVSDLRRGRLERMSLERLIRWLRRTGHVVELKFKPVVRPRGMTPSERGSRADDDAKRSSQAADV